MIAAIIKPTTSLIGTLSPRAILQGTITPVINLTGLIQPVAQLLGEVHLLEDYDHYQGAYRVSPLAKESVILNTEGKVMDTDVTVLEVPFYETSNRKGTTVYIASDPAIKFS